MTMIACNGLDRHQYDDEKHSACPWCRSVDFGVSQPAPGSAIPPTEGTYGHPGGFSIGTSPLQARQRGAISDGTGTRPVKSGIDGITVGVMPFNPVVGWLVVTSDDQRGRDFRFHSGWNSVGRGPDCAVCVDFDQSVSRGRHAHVVYDPESNEYFVKHSDGAQGTRLNGRMVGDLTPLAAGDTIRVGRTDLVFVPLCTAGFRWFEDSGCPEKVGENA